MRRGVQPCFLGRCINERLNESLRRAGSGAIRSPFHGGIDMQPKRRTLGLVEHVRLRGSNLTVQGLKVQPTDEFIADVL